MSRSAWHFGITAYLTIEVMSHMARMVRHLVEQKPFSVIFSTRVELYDYSGSYGTWVRARYHDWRRDKLSSDQHGS